MTSKVSYGKRRLIIMRGPSGSGKSTISKQIVSEIEDAIALSTDDYFVGDDGAYNFNFKALSKAHQWNQFRADEAMKLGLSTVVVDNCNLEAWEAQPYVASAKVCF